MGARDDTHDRHGGDLAMTGSIIWWMQRISAVILLVTMIVFGLAVLVIGDEGYQTWSTWMGSFPIRLLVVLTGVSIVMHGYIGIHAVVSDYLTPARIGRASAIVWPVCEVIGLAITLIYAAWLFGIAFH